MSLRPGLATVLAMLAFAANSIFCRQALGNSLAGPADFTAIRLASGALMLSLLVSLPQRTLPWKAGGNLPSGLLLFAYAAFFSFAYLSLTAGTGALILFGSVQFTMIGWGLVSGSRPTLAGWIGVIVAVIGLIWLVSPGLKAPPPGAACLMALSGMAWGFYSIRGRKANDAAAATAGNFVFAAPFSILLVLIWRAQSHVTLDGIALAAISGAITSAFGYVLWYAALPSLNSTAAAAVQLSVPVITAVSGAFLLGESPSWRLAGASILILGGVAAAVRKQSSTGATES